MGYQMFRTKKDAKKDLGQSLQLMTANLKDLKENSSYETFEIVRVGRFIEGRAYYHEVDQYYTCVGFEVEVDTRFDFDGKLSEMERNVGFYSIWMGKSHEFAPFTFEESYQELGKPHRFDNGLGDHLEIDTVLATIEDVTEALKEL